MFAKNVIDGVRIEAGVPLPLARARNAVARLLYGAPYSAVLPAESAGHLSSPQIDDDRVAKLAQELGPWIHHVAAIARQRLNGEAAPRNVLKLPARTILEIAQLAAARDMAQEPAGKARGGYTHQDRQPSTDTLTARLEQKIKDLSAECAEELAALAMLGRGDGGAFSTVLLEVQKGIPASASSWADEPLLHAYLATGLHRLGASGWKVLAAHPEMLGWLASGQVVEPLTDVELELETFDALRHEFAVVFEQANMRHAIQAYAAYVHRELASIDDLDYYGADEHFNFIQAPYEERQYAVAGFLGEIEIGKAYCCLGDEAAARKRLHYAQNWLSSLREALERGPEASHRAAPGGKGKAKRSEPLKQELMRLLYTRRPDGNWKSMRAAVDTLLNEMRAFNDGLTPRPLISAQMDSTLLKWVSKDAAIHRAYRGESGDADSLTKSA